MTAREQERINTYLDDLLSSDQKLKRDNAVDLIVLEFAVTLDEACDAYDTWSINKEKSSC